MQVEKKQKTTTTTTTKKHIHFECMKIHDVHIGTTSFVLIPLHSLQLVVGRLKGYLHGLLPASYSLGPVFFLSALSVQTTAIHVCHFASYLYFMWTNDS